MQRRAGWLWIVFLALGLFWGSSYLWIKIGVESLPPLTLITGRLLFGSLVLVGVVGLARERLPRDARTYGHLLVMSVINIVLPFVLITYGEQTIDSALAAILNATLPLFVIVLAPLFLPDERITVPRLLGLAVGFAGVIVLVAPGLAAAGGADIRGELLLVASSVSYAAGNVYSKRNIRGLRPMIPALFQVLFAALIVGGLALVVDRPWQLPAPPPAALVAMVWLGVLGSGLAYLCYFTLLQHWGSTRTSMVSYVLPVVGIALGAIVRDERITVLTLVGTALIIAGVALVNSAATARRVAGRAGRAARAISRSDRGAAAG